MFLQAGRFEEALSILQSVLDVEPDRWDTRAYTAVSLVAVRRNREAISLLDSVLDEDPGKPWLLVARAQANHGLGDLEAARRDYRDAMADGDDYPDAHLGLMELALAGADELELYGTANDAYRAAGWDPRVRLMAVLVFLAVDRPQDAERIVADKGLEGGPEVRAYLQSLASRLPTLAARVKERISSNPQVMDALPDNVRELLL